MPASTPTTTCTCASHSSLSLVCREVAPSRARANAALADSATALLVWRSVIQGRLDLFRRTANMIRVRRQPNKVAGLIAGHIPELARRGWHGGERCIVPCDLGVVRQLHGLVGPRLTFVEPEFDAAAVRAHEEMGAPDLLRTTAWDVWAELVKRLS